LIVRTPEEFSEGHIPECDNINWFDEIFLDQADKALPERSNYLSVLQVREGVSVWPLRKLVALGYTYTEFRGVISVSKKPRTNLMKIKSSR